MSEKAKTRLQQWKESATKDHGKWSCYWAGCRCQPCKDAWAKRARDRRARRLYEHAKSIAAGDDAGGTGYVLAAPARKHLRYLSRHHVGYKTVADLTGVSRQKLLNIKLGNQQHVLAATARKILAVTIDIRADCSIIPATTAKRRVAWLLREGHTLESIGRDIGINYPLKLQTRITAIRNLQIQRLYLRCKELDELVA